MSTPPTPILLPDLDGELITDLAALEEWAIGLEHAAEDGAELGVDAAALRSALVVLWGTASRAATDPNATGYGGPVGDARLLGPDGREYEPIRTGAVDPQHLAVLRSALEACRTARTELAEALETAAERYHTAVNPIGVDHRPDPQAPVRTLAAVLEVCTLSGPDVDALRAALVNPAHRRDGDIVLPPAADDARGRVADRITRAWYIDAGAATLHRWGMG